MVNYLIPHLVYNPFATVASQTGHIKDNPESSGINKPCDRLQFNYTIILLPQWHPKRDISRRTSRKYIYGDQNDDGLSFSILPFSTRQTLYSVS
ncbi:MAG: hypothetical protein IPG53_09130 [Ignavibacteriales bacterium]|nr:hypothetical protein [Ignavibacteriales bacterium]